MANGLHAAGIRVDETADGAQIHGGVLRSARIQSHGDHRISMAFAIAAQAADGELKIEDCANVGTSFPGFDRLATACGMQLRTAD
jgi:3-phosphoshikimate 1-carboxyvinyltransferase